MTDQPEPRDDLTSWVTRLASGSMVGKTVEERERLARISADAFAAAIEEAANQPPAPEPPPVPGETRTELGTMSSWKVEGVASKRRRSIF